MRFFFSLVILTLTSYKGKSQQVSIDILDSNSVNLFIKNSTVCEQIQAALDFSENIAQEKGFGIKFLEAISKGTGSRLYIPIATFGILYTTSQRTEAINEQLIEMRKQNQCCVK